MRPPGRGDFSFGDFGNPAGVAADAGRARRKLNLNTIQALQAAFDRGGRKAIDKVMKQQPALFLKMLVLLVPRELEVSHSGSIKAMSDEQIEQAIEAIQAMLDGRAAQVIDAVAEPAKLPPPSRRRARKPQIVPSADVGTDGDAADSPTQST